MIKDLLNNNGIRATKQRIDILSVISDKKIVTIKELEEELKDIDVSTIYRTLDLFLDKDIIEESIDNKKTTYTMHEGHKHYVKCIKCNSVEEINICPIKEEDLNGFVIINHQIKLDGICKKCNKKDSH